jgi:hypothetical protein
MVNNIVEVCPNKVSSSCYTRQVCAAVSNLALHNEAHKLKGTEGQRGWFSRLEVVRKRAVWTPFLCAAKIPRAKQTNNVPGAIICTSAEEKLVFENCWRGFGAAGKAALSF